MSSDGRGEQLRRYIGTGKVQLELNQYIMYF